MRTRSTTTRVLGGLLLLATGSALAVTVAASGAQRTAKSKPETGSSGDIRFTSVARSEIATGEGVRLTRTNFVKTYDGVDFAYIQECPDGGAMPDQVSDNSSNSFCYGSYHPPADFFQVDTGFYFYYDILVADSNGAWKPSGYYVDGATRVAMMGASRIDCSIKASGSKNQAGGAPFKCEAWFASSGSTPKPQWKVTAKPLTIVDASTSANVNQAAQLIGDNCTTYDTPRCNWTRTQKSSAFLQDEKDWQTLSNWFDSCYPAKTPNTVSVSRNVQVSWSDKVGGKISGKIAGDVLVVKVEATVEANYEHSVTQADTYGENYTYPIPLGFQSALYLQHGMLEVTGDFSIVDGNGGRFLVKNAVFRFPIQKDVQMGDRGQTVRRGRVVHVDIPCETKAPAFAAPPPASAKIGAVEPAKR